MPSPAPARLIIVTALVGAPVALAACGGTEADFEEIEAVEQSALVVSSKCFPAGKARWTTRATAMRKRPNGTSDRVMKLPKGTSLKLTDRNGDGQVCRAKRDAEQPNWFISVRRDGKRGWVRVDALRATPPKQNPIPGRSVTTPFGRPGGWAAGYHTGDDYAAPIGTRVVATRPGRVEAVSRTRYGSAYGLHVMVQTDGIRHLYAHLSHAAVSVGDRIGQGATIGRSGNSGNTTGPHLHYEERHAPFGYYDHRKPRFNR